MAVEVNLLDFLGFKCSRRKEAVGISKFEYTGLKSEMGRSTVVCPACGKTMAIFRLIGASHIGIELINQHMLLFETNLVMIFAYYHNNDERAVKFAGEPPEVGDTITIPERFQPYPGPYEKSLKDLAGVEISVVDVEIKNNTHHIHFKFLDPAL